MSKYLFQVLACTLILHACNNNSESLNLSTIMDKNIIECGDYQFTHSLNLKKEAVRAERDTLSLTAGEQTDLFCDPKGVATNTSAPLLFSTVDNTKPFTFTVKVKPLFTNTGTYSAGAILAFVDKSHWQKLCFEQDEEGNHRIVTVRTVETSDDNNHESVDSASVYLRMSSDTKVIGNYYSEDGKNWHLVRIYKNEYPAEFYLSISSQSPKDKAHTCLFSDIILEYRPVIDFRKGNM
ncbi:DUF1349 domain-containing protein [Bacteroides sp. AF34-31BH]|nr:DUF1349 domain-containing protein [Bacteroides sp. AF34-31BH]